MLGIRKPNDSRVWWCMPLIPALRDRDMQISEFEASLIYKVRSRTARAIQRNAVSKNQKINKQTKTRKESARFGVWVWLCGYPGLLCLDPVFCLQHCKAQEEAAGKK